MMDDNKFGMFIHWGIYAVAGLQEQVFARYDMPREEYEKYQEVFDPADYDPEKWVKLAKKAGMEYICFTAKHHDGFCMWDTKYTDYSIMHTPYGRDVLKMLADACRKYDMRLSLYYSNPDWHHPYGYNPLSTHQWKAVRSDRVDMDVYKTYIKNQLTELLTNYGPIYTLFWDIPPKMVDKSINELARELQPGILINDRGFDVGDFSTPEREYAATPDTPRFTRMTEACNSVGVQSWGYRRNEDFYSLRHLTSAIDHIMAMGGSYLLNVGPDEKGVIAPEYASRIEKIGDWYTRMEGALKDHESDPFDYGVRTDKCIVTKKNGKSYFHFYEGLRSNAVVMQNAPCPKSIRLLNTGEMLPFSVDVLPEFFDGTSGQAGAPALHIFDIPVDDLSNEPIVLEAEF
ncbi:MAG: alpha-L-fucosidase [Clostridia bacterium]|nr:alpha-L-fucosidase [Clostridia bacterium]